MRTDHPQAPAREQVDRQLGLIASIVACGVTAAAFGPIRETFAHGGAGVVLSTAALLVLIPASALLGRSLPLPSLRRLWIACFVLAFAFNWGWSFAYGTSPTWPWTWSITAGLACYAALIWMWPLAMALSALHFVAPAGAALFMTGSVDPDVAWRCLAYVGNVGFVALIVAIRGQLDAVWDAEQRALDRSHDRALQRADAEARRAASLFVHDEILSTLGAASLTSDQPVSELRDQARGTLTALDVYEQDLTVGEASITRRPVVGISEVAEWIEADASALCPGATVVVEAEHGTLPAGVAEQIRAAYREALRNSREHAGGHDLERAVNRHVTARLRPDAVDVVVSDDGVGFDPDAVRLTRLGVIGSILGRMESVQQGSATIDTAIGRGTTVSLGWHR